MTFFLEYFSLVTLKCAQQLTITTTTKPQIHYNPVKLFTFHNIYPNPYFSCCEIVATSQFMICLPHKPHSYYIPDTIRSLQPTPVAVWGPVKIYGLFTHQQVLVISLQLLIVSRLCKSLSYYTMN